MELLKPEKRRVVVTWSVDPALLKRIDKLRGRDVPRSRMIERLLRERLDETNGA